MPNLVMLAAGLEPETSTEADGSAGAMAAGQDRPGAAGHLLQAELRERLANGDVVASMAWSGDIYQENAIGAPKGCSSRPPATAAAVDRQHGDPRRRAAPRRCDHVDGLRLPPEIAATITEWVAYVTPVPDARDLILAGRRPPRPTPARRPLERSPTALSCSSRRRRRRRCTAIASSTTDQDSAPGTRRGDGSSELSEALAIRRLRSL